VKWVFQALWAHQSPAGFWVGAGGGSENQWQLGKRFRENRLAVTPDILSCFEL
jgi:hypothetical protein